MFVHMWLQGLLRPPPVYVCRADVRIVQADASKALRAEREVRQQVGPFANRGCMFKKAECIETCKHTSVQRSCSGANMPASFSQGGSVQACMSKAFDMQPLMHLPAYSFQHRDMCVRIQLRVCSCDACPSGQPTLCAACWMLGSSTVGN